MILYDYDANAILYHPLKDRTSNKIVKAWTTCHKKLTKAGHQPTLYILDNKASTDFKNTMTSQQIQYKLAPPNQH